MAGCLAFATGACRTSAIEVLSLGPNDTVLRVGDLQTMTVVLTDVPESMITVRLFTSDEAVAELVPGAGTICETGVCTIDVPAGATSGTYQIRALSVGTVVFTASVGPTSAVASAQVLDAKFIYDSGTPFVDSGPGTDSAFGIDSGTPGTDSAIGIDSAAPGTDSAVAPVCSSLSFDGMNDVVNVSLLAGMVAGAITIEAYVNFNSLTGTQVIVGSAGVAGPTLRANGDALEFLVDGVMGPASMAGSLATGIWYHLAGTYDPVAMTASVWIDGANADTLTAFTAASAFAGDVTFGAEGMPAVAELDGLVDAIRVSSTARYTAPFTPAPLGNDASTFGLWLFDEGAGTTATDTAAVPHDGMIAGAVYAAVCAP